MNKIQNYYSCLSCEKNNFYLTKNQAEEANEAIVCKDCNTHYIFKNNILRFVYEDNYANSFGFEWSQHKKTQIDSNSQINLSKHRLQIVTNWNKDLKGQLILEAGSGSGRFTEILARTKADIVTFDFSDAIDVNYANNKKYKNINFFQADLLNLPLKKNIFDKILCLGVIQHTPNPKECINKLISHLKPGGELVFDVYRKDLISLLQWKYILRPITKRVPAHKLYIFVKNAVYILSPITKILKSYFGKLGGRLSPIADYSELNISQEVNLEWSILDTFDRYSPKYDIPMSMNEVKKVLLENQLVNIEVKKGLNGIIASGQKQKY